MGKLALTVIGMGIGFALGGPFGAQIGAMVGGMVGNMLFAPTIKGPRLSDLSVTSSTYGNIIPELYGTMRLAGNVIWSAGIKEHKHKSVAGKGGPKQVTYSYTCSWAIAFCKGEVNGITRIWADGKLIAGNDPATATGTGEVLATSGILNLTKKSKGKFSYRFYTGSEDQVPDQTIIADKGEGNVPAYRDLAYLIFADMPLEDFGNRLPQITAELTRTPVVQVPYANLTADVTQPSSPGPDWSVDGTTVDFASQRTYRLFFDSLGNPWFIHYDLRTMQELFRVPVALVENGGGPFDDPRATSDPINNPSFNPAFSIGGKYFFANTSLHNSGTGEIWDGETGAGLGRIGHESNNFPANPIPDDSQPFYPEGALIGTFSGQALWMRTLGLKSQNDILYHCGNLGSSAIFWTPARYPVHTTTFPFDTAAQWTPMRGAESTPSDEFPFGQSDMLFLNHVYTTSSDPLVQGWDVWLKRVTLVDQEVMRQNGGPPYSMTNAETNIDTDVKLPRPVDGGDIIIDNASYDQSDNSIVLWGRSGTNSFGNGGTWLMVKWMIDEGVYKWVKTPADLDPSLATAPLDVGTSVGAPAKAAYGSNLDGGTVGWMRATSIYAAPRIYVADLQTGEIKIGNIPSPLPNFAEGSWSVNAWDDQTQSIMGAPNRLFVQAPGGPVPLQAIVDDLMLKTRTLQVGDWDSSALAGIGVHGYIISNNSSVKDCLGQLAGAYFFDGFESDYIIKMRLRGGPSVGTITEKHLGFAENKDIVLKETRTQELEMPMRVTVSYADVDRNYQTGTQSAKRNTDPFPTMFSKNEVKFELPIAMSATDAKQIADKSLKMSWSSRWNYKMKLPWEFVKYDPSDVLDVVMNDGSSYLMRFDKTDLGVDFTIDLDALSEKPAAYVSTVIGDPGTGVPIQTVNVGGPCDLYIFNTPLLRDIDDTQGTGSVYYISAKAQSPGDFKSCYLFEATDTSFLDYEPENLIPVEPTWGTMLTALPNHFDYGLDAHTTMTVRVMSMANDLTVDVLESITYDELLAGKNAVMIGNEIVQFMTATARADGRTYDLTNILRARRGTNYATSGHTAGERFVMLEQNGSIVKQLNSQSEWAQEHRFKAVPPGGYSEAVYPTSVDMEPNDLKPYTPECVQMSSDGTDVTITFERRSRIGNELADGPPSVPYKEGQGSLAHFVYKVWGNKLLSDKPWDDGTATAFDGIVPIYSGVTFAALTFNFPVAGIASFVVELYEVGYVDGFPKYVQFVNLPGTNFWDMTELY